MSSQVIPPRKAGRPHQRRPVAAGWYVAGGGPQQSARSTAQPRPRAPLESGAMVVSGRPPAAWLLAATQPSDTRQRHRGIAARPPLSLREIPRRRPLERAWSLHSRRAGVEAAHPRQRATATERQHRSCRPRPLPRQRRSGSAQRAAALANSSRSAQPQTSRCDKVYGVKISIPTAPSKPRCAHEGNVIASSSPGRCFASRAWMLERCAPRV